MRRARSYGCARRCAGGEVPPRAVGAERAGRPSCDPDPCTRSLGPADERPAVLSRPPRAAWRVRRARMRILGRARDPGRPPPADRSVAPEAALERRKAAVLGARRRKRAACSRRGAGHASPRARSCDACRRGQDLPRHQAPVEPDAQISRPPPQLQSGPPETKSIRERGVRRRGFRRTKPSLRRTRKNERTCLTSSFPCVRRPRARCAGRGGRPEAEPAHQPSAL